MTFKNELEFEKALIKILSEKGWEEEVLENYTEKQLIENWASILFENNRGIDRLNNYPLTDGEMMQILETIESLKTPLKLNGFINGKTVTIKRDHPEDVAHFGKEISLKIYDRREIAAGQSRYQIARQPRFPNKNKILNDRKGDFMLLINGMPVIHVELKKSDIPVSQASYQIEKYSYEGVFTGLFSLIQIFVAMTPEETIYFANPGPEGRFNKDFYFHWADFNNEPINNWKDVASSLLSIPMAHQLIGFYTVADNSDGVLKVMRSYQYYAANAISDKVSKTKWMDKEQLGGYIWHTTGSGKTMTSFKSAQLVASSNDADKVVFLTDRIELGTQSLKEYRAFASDRESVQATENTNVLITKLKSTNPDDTLIVTSIQKMSNIKDEDNGLKAKDIEIINRKRLVFIVDEAHRSTFGDMLATIKETFPKAIFFGFTGTPIHDENIKKDSTTATVFGNELHRYSIADGIRDKNVLGFDPYMVSTFDEQDLKKIIALKYSNASTEDEMFTDPLKKKMFYEIKNKPMAGYFDEKGDYVKGIEDFIPKTQYTTETHREMVVKDIAKHWTILSHNGKFHAIFATGSINEAIEYYRLLKEKMPKINITSLFDPNIDNEEGFEVKLDGLEEIIVDYNNTFDKNFTFSSHAAFKRDLAARLAHKEPYINIDKNPKEQLHLLIVVDQMLTGFDSKWINTLYLDKLLEYENIIQAFSRTNRLFGPEKPFGTIKYYRKPHTMRSNINKAVKLYSGDKVFGLYADKLEQNLRKMNELFIEIKDLFKTAGVYNFERLPADTIDQVKFASLFNEFNKHYEAAKVQGFRWSKLEYKAEDNSTIEMQLDETIFLVLVQRYKEIQKEEREGGLEPVPFDIEGSILTIDTELINSEYMNKSFDKYKKKIKSYEEGEEALNELHKTFASLSQEDQKYANIFLNDIKRGDVIIEDDKTLRDYITEYKVNAKNDQIKRFADTFGIDEKLLRNMMSLKLTESNINEYGRLDELKSTLNKELAKVYFEKLEDTKVSMFKVNLKFDKILREFLLSEGFDL